MLRSKSSHCEALNLSTGIREYYEKLERSAAVGQMAKEEIHKLSDKSTNNQQLFDMDDQELIENGLPERWSELEDRHFPLFLSYPQLARLLEKDFEIQHGFKVTAEQRRALFRRQINGYSDLVLKDPDDHQETTPSKPELNHEWLHYIDFKTFKEQWTHFDSRLTKGLDPALCFSEVLGVISGSTDASESEKVRSDTAAID